MTTEELYETIQQLTTRVDKLEKELLYLRKWSDDNDYWLREMIDALTESVDKNFDKININIRDINENSKKIEELIERYHK